jgi:Holliday junction resolvase RusA-like endonuclease
VDKTEFFMSMANVPTMTHQQKKVKIVNGKPVFYESAELKAVRVKLMAHLAQHIPAKKYTSAVRVVAKFCYPITDNYRNGEYKTTVPDVDNSIKLLNDCCTALGYWEDDSLISSLIVEKLWAERPGIYVCIENL